MSLLKHLPNLVSLFRLLLIVPFLNCLEHHAYAPAFYVFLIAGATDTIDGWLARHFHCQTPLGHFIDPLADKLLIATSVISLALLGQFPWWLVVLVFSRDISISVGVFIWYLFVDRKCQFVPSRLSKVNTAIQILLVGFCLLEIAFKSLRPDPVPLLIMLAAATTALTYIDYGWTASKQICALAWPKKI